MYFRIHIREPQELFSILHLLFSSFMGNYLSKTAVSDPSSFATPFHGEKVETAGQAQEAWKTYDYVIVGAGAAGCVLANRLSSDPDVSVLLIEAGSNNEKVTSARMPAGFLQLFKSKYDWEYYTSPQPNLNNRECYWPRGKILGGSTSMNAMVYHHGSPSDFDEWEKLGATGWCYEEMMPYFRKAEKFTPHPKYPDVRIEDRGNDGSWQTSFVHTHPIAEKFVLAAEELGIPHNPDLNTKWGTFGATKFFTFVDQSGLRSSAATAYLSPSVIARKNLTIATESQVTRVIFSTREAIPRAIGVEVSKSESSQCYRVAARKEIVLSAGALGTPQIMMLSGIGAQEELERFAIPIVKELPAVGKNLSDHLTTSIVFRAESGTSLDWMMNDSVKTILPLLEWYLFGKGPYTSNIAQAGCFVRTTDESPLYSSQLNREPLPEIIDVTSASDAPDMEIMLLCCGYLNQGSRSLPAGTDSFTFSPIILRPLSKGSMSLRSTSPFDKLLVDPNYLSHPNDLKVLIRGVRLALRMARTNAMKSIFKPQDRSEDKNNDLWFGDADPDRITDEEITEHIKEIAETIYHPVGTCRMGQNEKGTVVGPDLKVHGINGLRIADASIFPEHTSGHPTAVIIAIGEKASDIIMKGS